MKNLMKTVVLASLLAASVSACKKKDGGGGGGGGGETGVAECDDYLAKMDACAKKLGDKGGEGITKMANMMRGAWKDDVKDAAKKAEMPKTCTSAIKDMKKQMPDCDWGGAAEPAGSAAAAPAGSGSAAGSAAPAAAAGGGDIPAECNDYKAAMEKLAACDKMPQASKDALKQGYDAMSQGWANAGSLPPEAKKAMADGCKQGADALMQSGKALCGW